MLTSQLLETCNTPQITNTTLASIKAFVSANETELRRILAIVVGPQGTTHIRSLVALLAGEPHVEPVLELLADVRDALASAKVDVGADHPTAGPDFDAAVRWLGARLDDLLVGAGADGETSLCRATTGA